MTPEELLKEVGEPVYFEWRHCDTSNDPKGIWSEWKKVEPRNAYVNTVEDSVAEFDAYIAQGYKYELRKLYTSDQLAAAILKATKPLEGKIERLKRQSANRLIGLCKGGEDNDELRAQLAAAQAYAEQLQVAIEDTVDRLRNTENWLWEDLAQALALPHSTSALDAYVSEKLKEIIESHAPEGRNVTNAQYVEMRHKFVEQITTLTQQHDLTVEALENCRLLAARHRKEEWAGHIMRFCKDAGLSGSPIRNDSIKES